MLKWIAYIGYAIVMIIGLSLKQFWAGFPLWLSISIPIIACLILCLPYTVVIVKFFRN